MSIHTCTAGSEFETSAGLCYRKVMLDNVSSEVIPHTHNFAHDMIVTSGTIVITLDDVESTCTAGDVVTVPAESVHSVKICPCVDTAVFLCVWSKYDDMGTRETGDYDVITQGLE